METLSLWVAAAFAAAAMTSAYAADTNQSTITVDCSGAVAKIAAAAATAHWLSHWHAVAVEGGDEGAPDCQLAISGEDRAATGREPDASRRKMVAHACRPTKAAAIRKSLGDAIAKIVAHHGVQPSYITGVDGRGPVSRLSGTAVG